MLDGKEGDDVQDVHINYCPVLKIGVKGTLQVFCRTFNINFMCRILFLKLMCLLLGGNYTRGNNGSGCMTNELISKPIKDGKVIDIDQKDFGSKTKLDLAMNRVLKKIKTSMHGRPTWVPYGQATAITFTSQWQALS